jgi:hypothetical protein
MSDTFKEILKELETLNLKNMYKNDFFLTWDKTSQELAGVFAVADALRDLRERNLSTKIFDSGLGISTPTSSGLARRSCW